MFKLRSYMQTYRSINVVLLVVHYLRALVGPIWNSKYFEEDLLSQIHDKVHLPILSSNIHMIYDNPVPISTFPFIGLQSLYIPYNMRFMIMLITYRDWIYISGTLVLRRQCSYPVSDTGPSEYLYLNW